MRFILLLSMLTLLSCANRNTKEDGFYLYYADNGGTCLPCMQAKQAAKKIYALTCKSQPELAGQSLQVYRTDTEDENDISKTCSPIAREIMIVKREKGRISAFKKFPTEEIVIFPDRANEIVISLADSVNLFISENSN